MRMGQPEKSRRGDKKAPRADAKGKPMYAAGGSIVGQLSPDIITTYFMPELMGKAQEGLENYASQLMEYDDAVGRRNGEAEVVADGNVNVDTSFLSAPATPLYSSQHRVDELEEILTETSKHFHSKKGGWKIRAKAARFERLMDEKYGMFRPFLKEHPQVEHFVKSVQRKYATGYFSPFRQGKPPIPKSTAIVILFMMQRGNLRWEITLLAVLFFLVGLQPWALVVLVAGATTILEGRKKKPKVPMRTFIPLNEPYYSGSSAEISDIPPGKTDIQKTDKLLQPVGAALTDKEEIDTSKYDTLVLGYGPDALYTAALMSRAGRKVLVLCSRSDASGCHTIEVGNTPKMKNFESVPFDVESSNVSKVSRQQALLAPALCSSTDNQGGVRFAQIGSDADGHAFEILEVPGMGVERGDEQIPFVLRADGTRGLMDDAAACLGDGWPGLDGDIGNSTTGLYAATCEAINSSSNQFFLSKVLSDGINGMRSNSTYQETSIRYASAFLDKGFPLNAHTRSLFAAIGMKGENIKPSMTSMGAHVTNICAALSGEGMHYPIGGPRALCHVLATVVEQSGGRIITNAPISELIFEPAEKQNIPKTPRDESEESDVKPPRCIGVKLMNKHAITLDTKKWLKEGHEPAIISMHGFVSTFIRLLPEDIRVQYKVPRGLPALSERRPVFKVLFALDGSAEDLDLSGADFYRVPGAALAQDEMDPVTGQVTLGELGWVDEEKEESEIEVDEINKDPPVNPQGDEVVSPTRGKRGKSMSLPTKPNKRKKVRFETGASWIHISFPSAKDPSFEQRHGRISTCVVTIEADDDFVTPFETKPKLYSVHKRIQESSGEHQRLMDRVSKDLLSTYPQLEGKILRSQLVGPMHRGLSHNPERYAAKGVRPESPYPGLFLGGSDLTVGESFGGSIVGGWLAANAVMGYSALDYLYLKRSITSDIARFLESPDLPEEEDLAVPFDGIADK